MAESEQFIQAFSRIFGDTDAYAATLTGTQLGQRGETFPGLFENQEKCHDFGKKGLDCVHCWIKFSIQNAVLRV